MYQDNMSAMLLEKKLEGLKRTRRINIIYFLAKYRVNAGEVVIEHCPTGDIWGFFFTEPLQESEFKSFRYVTLGK